MRHNLQGFNKRVLTIIVPALLLCTLSAVSVITFMLHREIWSVYEKSVIAGLEAMAGELSCTGLHRDNIKKIIKRAKKSSARHFVIGKNARVIFFTENTASPDIVLRQGAALLQRIKAA